VLAFHDEQGGQYRFANLFCEHRKLLDADEVLDLRLTGDASTGNVTAAYSVN